MSSDGTSELTAGGGQGGGQALKAAAAPEIEWYMRLYFRMSAAPCKLANKLILWHPVDAVVSLEKLVRFPMGAAPEVRWWTTRLRRGGTILPETWVHSHRGRYGGCLVVAGRHSLWSLAGMPMTARDQAMPTTAPSWSIGSASELRAHLALRAEAAGTLVCHDVAEEPVFLRLPPASDGSGGYHDRAGRFVCETGRHFEAEEEWTVFFFSTPNFSPKMRMYMQHMLVMLRYAPDAPLRTSIVDEVFPCLRCASCPTPRVRPDPRACRNPHGDPARRRDSDPRSSARWNDRDRWRSDVQCLVHPLPGTLL